MSYWKGIFVKVEDCHPFLGLLRLPCLDIYPTEWSEWKIFLVSPSVVADDAPSPVEFVDQEHYSGTPKLPDMERIIGR